MAAGLADTGGTRRTPPEPPAWKAPVAALYGEAGSMTQSRGHNARPAALIVAGPTASGKSTLALGLAERLGGTVINADSMQVYRELRVLTARPTPDEAARVPHRLYGIRPAAEAASVAWWRDQALAAMAAVRAEGRLPILCGGTGLYFLSLTEGLSAIPPVPAPARDEARALLAAIGAPALHARLAAADPETAATLRPGDGQRVARAFEVWRGTGRGLVAWHREGARTGPAQLDGLPWRFAAILLDPPREVLRAAIDRRFDAMLRHGALEEVRALGALNLDPALPAMRAHGVPELLAHLAGRMTLAAARERAVLNTGRYTKRQATWFRHHALTVPGDDPALVHSIHARIDCQTQFLESNVLRIFPFVHGGVDAAQQGA